MKITLIVLLLLISLTGCSTNRLVVQTQYFSHENLASFYVGTPDPLQNDPPVGQSLLIFWRLGSDYSDDKEITIKYTIRFRNKNEVQDSFKITRPRGYYTYSSYNDDYFKNGGILTYKVDLLIDGVVVEEWRQHLWKELIKF